MMMKNDNKSDPNQREDDDDDDEEVKRRQIKRQQYLDYCRNLKAVYRSDESSSDDRNNNDDEDDDDRSSNGSIKTESNHRITIDEEDDFDDDYNGLRSDDRRYNRSRKFFENEWLENRLQSCFKHLNQILEDYDHHHHQRQEIERDDEIFLINSRSEKRTISGKAIESVTLCNNHQNRDDGNSIEASISHRKHRNSVDDTGEDDSIDQIAKTERDDNSIETAKDSISLARNGCLNRIELQMKNLEELINESMLSIETPTKEETIVNAKVNQRNGIVHNQSDLICLILTRPDSRSKKDSLLYAFDSSRKPNFQSKKSDPNETVRKTITSDLKLQKFSSITGLFVTLNDLFEKLYSNNFDDENRNDCLAECDINLGSIDQKIAENYNLSFRIEIIPNDELDCNSSSPRKSFKTSVPVIVCVGLPRTKYDENLARSILELVIRLIRIRYGPMPEALRLILSHNRSMQIYLDKTLRTIDILLSTQRVYGIDDPSHLTLRSSKLSLMILSNCLPLNVISSTNLNQSKSNEICDNRLLIQNYLFIGETIQFKLQQYLNDYDSLDWIDESMQFYKQDGNDLEQALSEHFARCLQSFRTDLNATGIMGSVEKSDSIESARSIRAKRKLVRQSTISTLSSYDENDEQQIFDLLEIELTFFTVIGSSLYYRGLRIQSTLSKQFLSSIETFLVGRGLIALTKHRTYPLLYFARFNLDIANQSDSVAAARAKYASTLKQSKRSDLFILVMGNDHLLHCSLIEVFRFDRIDFDHLQIKTNHRLSLKSNEIKNFCDKTENLSSLNGGDFNDHEHHLPSSFAFYVFIKESFRLLNYYSHSYELLKKLEEQFQLFRDHSREVLIEFNRTLVDQSQTDTSWIERLSIFNLAKSITKSKNLNEEISEKFDPIGTEKKLSLSSIQSLNFPLFQTTKRSSRQPSPSPSSLTITNRSSSLAPSIESSLRLSTNRSNESIQTESNHSLIYDLDTQLNHCSNIDFIPKSLICFWNLEHQKDFPLLSDLFYGPLIGYIDLDDFGIERIDKTNCWLETIVMELYDEMKQLRQVLRSISATEIERRSYTPRQQLTKQPLLERNSRDKMLADPQQIPIRMRHSKLIEMNFDIDGNLLRNNVAKNSSSFETKHFDENGVQFEEKITTSTIFCLKIFLIGCCSLRSPSNSVQTNPMKCDPDFDLIISNELYACFRIEQSLQRSESWKKNSNRNSSNDSRSSFGRKLFHFDSFLNQTELDERIYSYELNQIDSLWNEFDNLQRNLQTMME
ncbi:hypothetical protein SSS_08327 [Sarcoptes scabiei]|uniref:CCZ1/INTU second Longin domain-containing protein n=2 Tax=Sarcoptes scabiei TaxID=52283 RepID=A0A834RG65_SARSC|nr:hypothetical protein SSS_08327 [Sarcoptes scabiei]